MRGVKWACAVRSAPFKRTQLLMAWASHLTPTPTKPGPGRWCRCSSHTTHSHKTSGSSRASQAGGGAPCGVISFRAISSSSSCGAASAMASATAEAPLSVRLVSLRFSTCACVGMHGGRGGVQWIECSSGGALVRVARVVEVQRLRAQGYVPSLTWVMLPTPSNAGSSFPLCPPRPAP